MSNWRRQKPRNNFNNYHQRVIPQSSNPPLGDGMQSVPEWEKEFCAVAFRISWLDFLEAKRFTYLYSRVVEWDDSAGEEAFKNAKARFWAERNGLACDVPVPGPDLYIDEVDWNAEDDLELLRDLERPGPEPVAGGEQVVILDALIAQQWAGIDTGVGWGDAEGITPENVQANQPKPCDGWKWNESGFGDAEVKPENSWEYPPTPCDGWIDNTWGLQEKTETWDQKNNYYKPESWGPKNNGFKTESWNWNQKKSYNNSFNQGSQSREWRKRGDQSRRGEDCRWGNGRGRGRNRGGFQQNSNRWGWTETF